MEECRDCSDLPCPEHLPEIQSGVDYDGWADDPSAAASPATS